MRRLVLPTAVALVCLAALAALPAEDTPPPSRAVADSVNAFSADLYTRLAAEKDGNLFFSPASISAALTLTYAGARGETAEEMAAVLHLPQPADAVHPAWAALLGALKSSDKGLTVSTANALWGQRGFGFDAGYVSLVGKYYGGGLREADYAADPDAAREEINGWVAANTANRIRDLLAPGEVTTDTRLVLANAVYFKGKWAKAFDPKDTRERDFRTSDGETVKVGMMHARESFEYAETNTVQVLEMPYRGDRFAMVVVLPRAADGLPAVEKALTAGTLDRWLGRLEPAEVTTDLPRFESTAKLSKLTETLRAMGMIRAFGADADFSGLAPGRQLYLSFVVHKAFVEVDEEGTEAAAATGVGMAWGGISVLRERTFTADHPFLFFIRDTQSGVILFMGRFTGPGERLRRNERRMIPPDGFCLHSSAPGRKCA